MGWLYLLIPILTLLYYRRKRWMSILSRNGIPGPKPSLISGNRNDFKGMSSIERQKSFIQKYGKIVGYYNGAKPIVLVADPELAKDIQIKDFHYFYDRQHMIMKDGMNAIPEMRGAVHRTRGQRWKQIRSILTPTFSASKLKTMTPIMEDAIDTMVELVDNHSKKDEEFDIYELFQGLTTDVIGRTAFGVQTNVQKEPNNKFLKAAKEVFNAQTNRWFVLPINYFPKLDLILYPYRRLDEKVRHMFGRSPTSTLLDMSHDIIEMRKRDPNSQRKDLLQLMIDSKLSREDLSAMSDDKLTASTDHTEVKSTELTDVKDVLNKNSIGLTNDEIKANCVLFFEAGYETTSTALGFAAHLLVNHTEVQERVRQEVRELYESEGKLDFNTVAKLQYMEWVLNETMRIFPPLITFVTRETIRDYNYKDITIPKGASIQFPTYYLHHDPDYWQEPEKFDPERFSPERKHEINPSSWQPFGDGPRNCVGMRFAFFEMKLCLAKLLLKYRLVPGPNTEIGELRTVCKLVSLAPKYGVLVKAITI